MRDSDVTVIVKNELLSGAVSTLTRRQGLAPERAGIPPNDAGFGLVERRGRDLNLVDLTAQTVFETASSCLADYFDFRAGRLSPGPSVPRALAELLRIA